MNKISVVLSDGEELKIEIERPELIYGATAIMLKSKTKEGITAINPLTKENIPIILGNQNKFIIPLHNKEDYEIAQKYKLPHKLAVMPYFTGEGESKIKENVETKRRHSIIAIIENKETEEYLCEKSKNGEYKSFVQGGIEEGETVANATLREIKEETGYIDIAIDNVYEIPIINHFFAAYKGKNATNRFAKLEIVFGYLKSLRRIDITEEEKKKQEVIWVKRENLEDFININHNKFALDVLLKNIKVFEGEGIMNTNDENNEKGSIETRKIIQNKYCKLRNKSTGLT